LAGLRTLLKPGEPVALWAISVDSAADSRKFSDTIAKDGKGALAFPLLSDAAHRVIDAYGLQDPRYLKQSKAGIPYPTTLVIDKAGKVAWTRLDHDTTQRPSNSEVHAALDRLR
jgi:peroxiredoxin